MIFRRIIVISLLCIIFNIHICSAEIFFPIGIFSVGMNGLETVKEVGFNTAHTYITKPDQLQKIVETAEKLNLKLLIYPSVRCEKGVINNDKAKKFIEANNNSEAILAWFIADEPELNGGTPSQIAEINSFIKKLDPDHPTAIVVHRPDRYKEYRDASDILMTDRYPIPKKPLSHVAEVTAWALKQKNDSGPVWAIIQAFGYQNPQFKGWGAREPTYDEMRAMTFLAIIHGAKGIFYYTFIGSQYRILQSPEHWNDLKRIVAELNEIYPLLLLPNDDLKVDIHITEGPQKDEWGVLPVHLTIKHLTEDLGGLKAGFYIIAANSMDKPVEASFRLNGVSALRENVIDILGKDRKLNTKNQTFVDTFRPYDVHVYKISGQFVKFSVASK
jgi:hypothetical protein